MTKETKDCKVMADIEAAGEVARDIYDYAVIELMCYHDAKANDPAVASWYYGRFQGFMVSLQHVLGYVTERGYADECDALWDLLHEQAERREHDVSAMWAEVFVATGSEG